MVLPGFLLRALIPLGFMPMFGPGHSVTLALCEGYAPVASLAMDMSMDMPMGMPMDVSMPMDPPTGLHAQHGHPPVHQDHGACPYGASPTLAALVQSIDPAFAVEAASQGALAAPQIEHAEIARRAQSPRGPPQQV
jgi:hypothetical protein